MNARFFLTSLMAASLGTATVRAQATATSPAPTESAPAPAVSTDQMLEVYGWFLGQQMELYSFGFSDDELAAVSRGLAAAARGDEASGDLETVGPQLQAFLGSRPAQVREKRVAEGKAEAEKLFAKVDAKPGVMKTDSGLRYEIIDPGTGPKPTLGDKVVAHYTGTFVNGKVFDSSVERGEPAEFPLNGVIPGWQEGLQLIGVGGHIKLYIPGDLAYGDTGRMNIPPAKALVFDVKLLDVKPEQPKLAPTGPAAPEPGLTP